MYAAEVLLCAAELGDASCPGMSQTHAVHLC